MLRYRSFVSLWLVEFSCGRLEASLFYSNGGNGLADKQDKCPPLAISRSEQARPPATLGASPAKK
jgi:hypothetical protein